MRTRLQQTLDGRLLISQPGKGIIEILYDELDELAEYIRLAKNYGEDTTPNNRNIKHD
jgi:hypothetical protein